MTRPDALLTSIARQEIPDSYVRIHVYDNGERNVSLHAGAYNAERQAVHSIVASVDPLRVALDHLIDGYFAARRPGSEAA